MTESGPIFLPQGFKFSSATAGIKASGKPDLALILADRPTSAAALFTKNFVTAAPVEVGRGSLRSEEHTSELQSRGHLVCRLLLEKKKYYLTTLPPHSTRQPSRRRPLQRDAEL